jgi:hypothetical protein
MPRASLLALRKNPRRNHLRIYCLVTAQAIQDQVNRRLEIRLQLASERVADKRRETSGEL